MFETKMKSPACGSEPSEPCEDATPESARVAMHEAWADHHHARDQTWKALQMVVVLAAGLVGVDVQLEQPAITIAAAILVVVATGFGISITLRHREVEVRKITHVFNCEQFLGLHRSDLICGVSVPRRVSFWDAFRFRKMNTSLFILRMHMAVIVFAALFIWARLR